jgi:hypothetical protein
MHASRGKRWRRLGSLVGVLGVVVGLVVALPSAAWAGPTYRFVATAHVSSGPSHASWLSCSGADDCVIVGPDLAKSFDGTHVTPIAGLDGPGTVAADGSDANDWHAVSCAPDGFCMAVGVDVTTGRSAYRASPTSAWTRAIVPMPADLPGEGGWIQIQSVSCASATFCLAVASFADGPIWGVVWRWDGTRWHAAHPDPAFGNQDNWVEYGAVSCWAAWGCIITGDRVTAAAPGNRAFRAVLEGTTWHVANLSAPAGTAASYGNGVSCWAPERCMIVGEVRTSFATLKQTVTGWRWDGTDFVRTAGYPVNSGPDLYRESCTSATFCVAAGFLEPASTPLVLRWDGSTWTFVGIHVTALPGTGPLSAGAYGVACTTAYVCRLVGNDVRASDPDAPRATFLDSLQPVST